MNFSNFFQYSVKGLFSFVVKYNLQSFMNSLILLAFPAAPYIQPGNSLPDFSEVF